MNEELTLAIDELRKRPVSKSWFIPVLLDPVAIPDREIGGGETLHDLQWVDLSTGPRTVSWEEGIRRIVALVDSGQQTTSPAIPEIKARIRDAVMGKAEQDLLGILRSDVNASIDAALEAFCDDEDQRSYSYLMRPICEVYGNQFSADQVVKLVTRGDNGNSRTGFHGLCVLFEKHYDHMINLGLKAYFEGNFQITHFLLLRERNPTRDLLKLVMSSDKEGLAFESGYIDQDYFFDKFMNRGESAFLDAVFSYSPGDKTPEVNDPKQNKTLHPTAGNAPA